MRPISGSELKIFGTSFSRLKAQHCGSMEALLQTASWGNGSRGRGAWLTLSTPWLPLTG